MMKPKEQRVYRYVCKRCGHDYEWVGLARHTPCPVCAGDSTLRTARPPRIKCKENPRNRYECIVFSRHKIEAGRKRRAIWQTEKGPGRGHLYLTCPSCVSIIDATWELMGIYEGGFLTGCLVCPECLTHFWAYLEGWKP